MCEKALQKVIFCSNHLTTDDTGERGSNNGTFGRNLGEATCEKVDILEMVFVSFAKNFNGSRAHDVIKVRPCLDFGQAAELSPFGITRKTVVTTSL